MELLGDMTSVEEMLCQKATNGKIMLSTAFELTPLCNMNCRMCYIRLEKEQQEREQALRKVEEWLVLAEKMKKMGVLFILLTGGEPFLYPGFSELYLQLKQMGFILTINTNGTLLTEELADMFEKERPRRINVTLYGASNETYAKVTGNPKGFEQVMNALKLLKERGIDVKLNCSMIRENKEDTPRILDISEELDMPLEYNTYMFPCVRNGRGEFPDGVRVTPEEAAWWEKYIKERQQKDKFPAIKEKVLYSYAHSEEEDAIGCEMRCRAGRSSSWIDWKGRITPCVFLESPTVNAFEVSLETAWEEIKRGCEQVKLPIECDMCRHRSNCSVCAACTKWETGYTDGKPEYMCRYMDEVVKLLKMEDRHGRE